MKAEYIPNTFSDLLVVNTARVSFDKWHDTFQEGKDDRLIDFLVKHNHWSPLAHPHITVGISGDFWINSLLTEKELLAGLRFKNSAPLYYYLGESYEVTGSLWALLRMGDYFNSRSLFDICAKYCPVSTAAFEKHNPSRFKSRGGEPMFYVKDNVPSSTYTVRVTAPIFVARQLVKHQVGMVWNEVSRRYVDSEPTIAQITEWRGIAEDKKQGSADRLTPMEEYIINEKAEALTKAALEFYRECTTVCPEQRRAFLPLATETSWIWTGSSEAWQRVFSLRLKPDAQKETRDCVQLIYDAIQPHWEN